MSSPAQAPFSDSPPPPDVNNSTLAPPSTPPAPSPTESASPPPPPPLSTPLSSPPSSSSSSLPPPPPSDSTPPDSSSPPPPPLSLSPPPPSGSVLTPPPPAGLNASPPPPPSSPSPSSSSSSISTAGWIGIAISGTIAVFIVTLCFYCLTRKKRRRHPFPPPQSPYYPPAYPSTAPHNPLKDYEAGRRQQWDRPSPPLSEVSVQRPSASPPPLPTSLGDNTKPYIRSEPPSLGSSRSWFTFEELQVATDNFSPANLLGQGGFGCVYKGTLSSGQVVAIKQLKVGGGQGDREFRAEVEIISRVHHRHLVSLVGYCIMEDQRLLVYDYVPNYTLEYHLHGKGRPVLNWRIRQRIALGAARGIAYLHEDCHPRIIHRDIKSSNILIDNNFEVQVSDFGLAKLNSDANTHVTTRVMGTFGYLAPEYAATGKLTEKSDVFSFGVVLLELITGRKSVDPTLGADGSLVEWARPVLAEVLEQSDLELIVDPKLNGDYDEKEMMRMVEAAAASVRSSAHKRPRMGLVVRALEEESTISDLDMGVKPGRSILYQEAFGGSSDYDSSQYSADMKKFRRLALGSQEYGSQYSGATSEYGGKSSTYGSEYQSSREVDRSGPKSQTVRPTVAPSTRDKSASPTSRGMNV